MVGFCSRVAGSGTITGVLTDYAYMFVADEVSFFENELQAMQVEIFFDVLESHMHDIVYEWHPADVFA